jgi:hypothetical protein
VALTINPNLAPRLKNTAIRLLPFWPFMTCYRVNFPFTMACCLGTGADLPFSVTGVRTLSVSVTKLEKKN